MWKRLELRRGLITDWYGLPNYEPHPTDIRFDWGEEFNYNNIDRQFNRWALEYGLIDVFEICELYHEPYTMLDSSFRSEYQLIARFSDLDLAMMWKLAYNH